MFLDILGACTVFLLAVLVVVNLHRGGKIVFMGRSEKIDFDKDITTVPPIPISSGTCSHNWDVLDDKMLEMPHEKKHVLVLQCRSCGMLDKTMAVTSTPPKPLPLPPPPPCNHSWTAITDNTLDVAHEKKIVVILTCKNCGAIEKTVETTSKAPQTPLPKSECRHKWEVEKRVLLDSAYEQMLESIKVKTSSYSSTKKVDPNKELDLDLNKSPTWMFKKTYVCVRVCTLCGEIDKTIASNFDKEEETE